MAADAPDASGTPPLTAGKKVLFLAVIGLALLAAAEGLSQVTLRIAYGRATESERLNDYDVEIGWVNMTNRRVVDRYGPGKHATHNSSGLRATREYTQEVPRGRYRVLFVGDSFTYGVDVGDDSTYVAQLERLAPSIEPVNMAVAGYGVDQMYLSYLRNQSQLDANALVLAFIGDDLRRMKLSAFLTQNPKPRLFLQGDGLRVANVPVPAWGLTARSSWRRELPNSMALVQILRSITDMFVQRYDPLPVAERVFTSLNVTTRERNRRFAVVYLPAQSDVTAPAANPEVAALSAWAFGAQIPFVDLTDPFKVAVKAQSAPLFVKDGKHYSEAGHTVVAGLMLDSLRAAFPDAPR